MTEVLHTYSPNTSLLSEFDSSELNKKNKLFNAYLSDLYNSDVNYCISSSNASKLPAKEIGFTLNKTQSKTSNEVFLNNRLNPNYHLKHHSTHLKTVTKLNEKTSENDLENIKQDTINNYLNDFNEFHRVQDINHRKRLSLYDDENSSKKSKDSSKKNKDSSHLKSDAKAKRFSLNTLKTITKLSTRNSKMEENQKKTKEKAKGFNKQASLKRNKSISYKPLTGTKNIPLFRKRSTIFKVSSFATSKTAYQDNDMSNKIFNVINIERLQVLKTKSKISEALIKRISENNYNSHSKIVNYLSQIDLRSKFDRQLMTKTEADKMLRLWQVYLTNMIALKIKERLLNPNKGFERDHTSEEESIISNYHGSEFIPTYTGKDHASKSSFSSPKSKARENPEIHLSPLKEKVNEYIQKNRHNISFATTMDNTQFSNSFIFEKTHDSIYTDYK